MLDRTALVNNGTGTFVQNSSIMRIGNSTVSGNSGSGLSHFQFAEIQSYGTNKVNGNGTDGAPTTTMAMK